MSVETVVYTEDGTRHPDSDTTSAIATARDADGTTWVKVTVGDAGAAGDAAETDEVIEQVSAAFNLHPLSIEDVRNDVRPKAEEFEGHTFLLVKAARLARGETTFDEEVRDEPVGLFLGDDWLVTLTLGEVDAVERVWATVDREDARLLRRDADFTAYRIVDALVDEYFGLLDDVEDHIEEFEEMVVVDPDLATLEGINEVRRDLLSIRKLLWPSREALGTFARGDPPQVRQETEKYYRDVYDHLVQLVDLVETYRDLASGARDIYLNALSISTNEVMKTLTVVATVVLPLTFVVGVYGMNFDGGPLNMPELGWRYGYPAAMLGMALVATILLAYFRQEEWL